MKKQKGFDFQWLPVEKLNPAAYNPRKDLKPGDSEYEKLKKSINEFGLVDPLIVNKDGTIIGGHQRYKVMVEAGFKELPCSVVNLDKKREKALNIALNKISGAWDFPKLKDLIAEIDDGSFDIGLTGWDAEELEEVFGITGGADIKDADPQIDRAEELNKTWKVKSGDLWQIGEHRLLCGDSTKSGDVSRVMNGEKSGLCFTSPPYGQQWDYDGDTKEKVSDWDNLMRGVFENLPLADDGQVLVNLGMIHRQGECLPYWENWINWMRTQGWRRFGWYVWDQGSGLPGDWNGRLAPSHEWIFHFNRISNRPKKFVSTKPASQKKGKRDADRSRNGEFIPAMRGKDGKVKEMSSPATRGQTTKIPDSVIRITRHMGNDIARESHPATFPTELPVFIAQCWPGDVFDPFIGSGTTMVACQNLSRKCRGIEISPNYCAVILQRITDAFPGIEIKRIE